MRVLVMGSSRDIEQHKDEIDKAGRELGKELAERGHTILVGGDDPLDVDSSIVAGALEDSSNKTSIEVHVPHGERGPYPEKAKNPDEKLEVRWHQFTDWNVTFMEVIRKKVDAVLAVGGRTFVVQAGTSAWMMGVPIIPVGSFGGGSKTLWEYSSIRREEFYHSAIENYEIDRLASPWTEGESAKFVVDVLEEVVKTVNRAKTPSRLLYLEFFLMIIALVGWVFFLVFPSIMAPGTWLDITNDNVLGKWQEYSLPLMFAAVIAAGLLGASMNTLRRINSGSVVTGRRLFLDTMLGITAGFVSAMLYLLAQIGINGEINATMAENDYIRVAIIVSMASLFAALFLDAAFARFGEISGSVMAGTFKESESS